MSRWSRPLVAAVLLAVAGVTACTAEPSPTPIPTPTATDPPRPTATAAPSATVAATESVAPSPSATPEPPLSLDPPEGSDARIVAASAAADGASLLVTVSSAATDRIDEIVLRWPAELDATLRLVPFEPSVDRISDTSPPLRQVWTKWVVGPGEQGEPAGTISVGWGPLLPGTTLAIPLVATRLAEGPIAFDLQLLAGNDLLSFEGGIPAELRVEVP
jgi:hypothetical protein